MKLDIKELAEEAGIALDHERGIQIVGEADLQAFADEVLERAVKKLGEGRDGTCFSCYETHIEAIRALKSKP